MDDYLPISLLNDFTFCPYSIYLHQVYMETDEGLYKALPQTRGTLAHEAVDRRTYSSRKDVLASLTVCSHTLRLTGQIDLYRQDSRTLVERKYHIRELYRGQVYQLWAQYFCMTEMGYGVDHLAFHATASNRTIPVALPQEAERKELEALIEKIRTFDPGKATAAGRNKCLHCIYCNLCDKTTEENVYV